MKTYIIEWRSSEGTHGRWRRSLDYPDRYPKTKADKIVKTAYVAIGMEYRAYCENELYLSPSALKAAGEIVNYVVYGKRTKAYGEFAFDAADKRTQKKIARIIQRVIEELT